jgi:hypothetical protein
MGPRISAFCLGLLAVLSATAATASPADSSITAGEIQLALSTLETSALPIDIQALAESKCTTGGTGWWWSGNLAQCRLTVVSVGDAHLFTFRVQDVPSLQTGHPDLAALQTTGMVLGGEPVETPCGVWEISLGLDTTDLQPMSPMALKPGPDDPAHGVFSTLLEMKVRLHLANQTTGQEIDEPLVLGLGLSGPWSLASSAKSKGKNLSESNLRLLHSAYEKCFPVWLLQVPENLAQFLSGNCRFCIEAPL